MANDDLIEITRLLEQIDHAVSVLFPANAVPPTPTTLQLPPDRRTLAEWRREYERQRAHARDRFTMLLLGASNAGKSTLLSAVLGLLRDRRLPIGDTPTNAIPIRFTYPQEHKPEAEWLLEDGRVISKSWQEAILPADQRNFSAMRDQIHEIVLYYEHPLLLNTDILDMPGTGTARYQQHTQITHEYMETADLIMLVIGNIAPDQSGVEDLRRARQVNTPIIMTFNAWGSTDPDLDAMMRLTDQQPFEDSIYEASRLHGAPVFEVYGRKCLETMDRGHTIPDEFGLRNLYEYILQGYWGAMGDHRIERRAQTLRRVAEHARRHSEQLTPMQAIWQTQADQAAGNDELLKRYRRKLDAIEVALKDDIATQARLATRKIIDYYESVMYGIIVDQVTLTNTANWRHLFKTKNLDSHFKSQFEQWLDPHRLDRLVEAYYADCLDIVRRHWLPLLQELNLEMERTHDPQHVSVDTDHMLKFMSHQAHILTRDMAITLGVVGGGLAASGLMVVFGPAIAGAAGAAGVASGAVATVGTGTAIGLGTIDIAAAGTALAQFITQVSPSLLLKDDKRPQDRALTQMRAELESQRDGIRQTLTDMIMNGPHQSLKVQFEASIAQRQTTANELLRAVNTRLAAIGGLLRAFNDTAESERAW